MKKRILIISAISLLILNSLSLMAKGPNNMIKGHPFDNTSKGYGIYYAISTLPTQEISDNEKAGLLKMREEEKLARDVYLTLYNKWGLQIFANIALSEQRHMDAIKMLLEKYNISDPISDDSIGMFSNEEFTNLFNELILNGESSEVEALRVGAKIEDLDIADLKELIENTDNEDIKFVYERLENGSKNHIRAFSKLLQNFGEEYIPQYITPEEYEEILSQSFGQNKLHFCLQPIQ